MKEAIRLLKSPDEYKKVLQPKKQKQTAHRISLQKKSPVNITKTAPKQMIFSDLA
jgi:carboxyl-terminal processing protease